MSLRIQIEAAYRVWMLRGLYRDHSSLARRLFQEGGKLLGEAYSILQV
jgi:hypothetical protein